MKKMGPFPTSSFLVLQKISPFGDLCGSEKLKSGYFVEMDRGVASYPLDLSLIVL